MNAAKIIEFIGKDNLPKIGKSSRYLQPQGYLIPCFEGAHVVDIECVSDGEYKITPLIQAEYPG